MTPVSSVQGERAAPPPEGAAWTVLHLIRWAAGYLGEKGVETPRLDAEHLLGDVLGMSRLDLYLAFDRPVSLRELAEFKGPLRDRAKRKPLQYILGRTAFRDLELVTDPRVLIPRPETEGLVEAVLERVGRLEAGRAPGLAALDVGTGSGAIAVSLALEGPFETVVATDVSESALEVARVNAGRSKVLGRVELRRGAGYAPVHRGERFDVVIANPPYVAEEELAALAPEVREWEPREALLAEEGGLAILRALVDGASGVLRPSGILALEVGLGQARWVMERIRGTMAFAEPDVLRDLSGRERVVIAVREAGGPWAAPSRTSLDSKGP